MIILAIALAGLAGFMLLAPSPARALRRRLRPTPLHVESPQVDDGRRSRRALTFLALVAIPVAAGTVAGVRGVCLGLVRR